MDLNRQICFNLNLVNGLNFIEAKFVRLERDPSKAGTIK